MVSPKSIRDRRRYAEDPDYRRRKLASIRRYFAANKDELNERRRIRLRTDPEYRERQRAYHRHGLTTQDYYELLGLQAGVCAICRKHDRPLGVDHCHSTGQVRGLLCSKCNIGLGQYDEDTDRMLAAIAYLEASRCYIGGRAKRRKVRRATFGLNPGAVIGHDVVVGRSTREGPLPMTLALRTLYFEDLSLGMTERWSKTIASSDVVGFAQVTGDRNPIHLSEHFAAKTQFKKRIAHGLYTASLISAVLGTRLPGPGAIYISQTLNFRAPVKIGDTVEVTVEVAELIPERQRARLVCTCMVADEVVLDGEAWVKVPTGTGSGRPLPRL